MALRDTLAAEQADHRDAAAAAAHGRSITGFSGRTTEAADSRFGSGDQIFGAPIDAPQAPAPEPPLPRRPAPPAMRNRKPFGDQEQKLAYPPRDGFRRYWANDEPGRVQRFLEAGYTHVQDQKGQPVSMITGKGTNGAGQSSYLMEIPIEWYQEDMARNHRALDDRLNDIRKGRLGPGSEDNRYVPQQGIRIEGR